MWSFKDSTVAEVDLVAVHLAVSNSSSQRGFCSSHYASGVCALCGNAANVAVETLKLATAPGSESRMERERKGGSCSTDGSVEEQIERSKSHWSSLAEFTSNEEVHLRPGRKWQKFIFCFGNMEVKDHAGCLDEGEESSVEVSNVQEFMALQRHPTWGGFFATFSGDGYSFTKHKQYAGFLEVGEKFAEGGQAELFHAHVTWWNPEDNENVQRDGTEYVLKVFKKGTFLKHLKSQLPKGLLLHHAWRKENLENLKLFPRYYCRISRGTLLKDGRFAFLMEKEHFDLRTLIECNMKSRSDDDGGPFPKEDAEIMMYDVALGMEWLHSRNIVHRDLKASNVLVKEFESGWPKRLCFVADYECSVGVVGTGFFRAPEILQACKDRKTSERPEVFSRAADAYSYGMTCYEILTGKLPFEDHPLIDNKSLLIDLVINQHLRPEVPQYVEDWLHELLNNCWQSDPKSRPSFEEIVDLLATNSSIVQRRVIFQKKMFGDNFRMKQLE